MGAEKKGRLGKLCCEHRSEPNAHRLKRREKKREIRKLRHRRMRQNQRQREGRRSTNVIILLNRSNITSLFCSFKVSSVRCDVTALLSSVGVGLISLAGSETAIARRSIVRIAGFFTGIARLLTRVARRLRGRSPAALPMAHVGRRRAVRVGRRDVRQRAAGGGSATSGGEVPRADVTARLGASRKRLPADQVVVHLPGVRGLVPHAELREVVLPPEDPREALDGFQKVTCGGAADVTILFKKMGKSFCRKPFERKSRS